MLLAFHTPFTKWQGSLFFAQVHATYHALKQMHTSRIQMTKSTMPKL
jgi:hypothetical protein